MILYAGNGNPLTEMIDTAWENSKRLKEKNGGFPSNKYQEIVVGALANPLTGEYFDERRFEYVAIIFWEDVPVVIGSYTREIKLHMEKNGVGNMASHQIWGNFLRDGLEAGPLTTTKEARR